MKEAKKYDSAAGFRIFVCLFIGHCLCFQVPTLFVCLVLLEFELGPHSHWQALYQSVSSFFVLDIFEIRSLKLFACAGLELLLVFAS
jgi:hypothetical protein